LLLLMSLAVAITLAAPFQLVEEVVSYHLMNVK
jgi:hypothetical protein